jgi:hypothetical protein
MKGSAAEESTHVCVMSGSGIFTVNTKPVEVILPGR